MTRHARGKGLVQVADTLQGLKPEGIGKWFAGICAIPHGSKNEAALMAWLETEAAKKGWQVRKDSTGNMVVDVPATPGREQAPILVLQGHADMVCEKNRGTEHDFARDPIQAYIEDGWVKARGTTLGADNGIGVAAALAIAEDPDCPHGPLELLVTVDEETGLTGAKTLDPALVKGRTMINLDTEEEGALYVGCAGGLDTEIRFPFRREGDASGLRLAIQIRGLIGGHSGLNIHEGRGNAIKIAGRVLYALLEGADARLCRINGGSKRNAIPREAELVVLVPPAREADLRRICGELQETIRAELPDVEKNMEIAVEPGDCSCLPFQPHEARDLARLIYALPNGVAAMSPAIPGLVETSTNIGVITTEKDAVQFVTSQRSSVDTAKMDLGLRLNLTAALAGAETIHGTGYPGWKPDLDSAILHLAENVWQEMTGKKPEVKAIHAGLECGIIGEKYPGMDMVSCGPNITGAHSPDEKMEVASVERFYRFVKTLVTKFSE